MSYYKFPLKAGVPFIQNTPGRLILIDSPGVAGGVDVQMIRNGTPGPLMGNRKTAFRLVGDYDGVILTAAVDTEVALFLSYDDVQLGLSEGSGVSVPDGVVVNNGDGNAIVVRNAVGDRLQVDIGGGAVNVTADNVGVNNTEENPVPTKTKLAAVINDPAPVAVAAAVSALLAADANRRGARFKNTGANPVALVGALGSFANAAVLIQPGETWNESEAPGAAWYGICDAGLASTINIQTIA